MTQGVEFVEPSMAHSVYWEENAYISRLPVINTVGGEGVTCWFNPPPFSIHIQCLSTALAATVVLNVLHWCIGTMCKYVLQSDLTICDMNKTRVWFCLYRLAERRALGLHRTIGVVEDSSSGMTPRSVEQFWRNTRQGRRQVHWLIRFHLSILQLL